MARNSSNKEAMLTKIRQALLSSVKQPFPQTEATGPVYQTDDEPLDIQFATEFTHVNGHFVFCENEKECVENLKELIGHNQYTRITCYEPELHAMFDRQAFINYDTDAAVQDTQVGITMCEALVARTGSILLSSRQPNGRTMPIYPEVHLVIASTEQIVADIQDGFALVRKKYNGNFPSMLNLNTGPSRTADIEKTLVLGAHGPRAVYVFLIDQFPLKWMHAEG
ncbi:MAG: LUD domain-containing protein [Chitinophagales bacterium]